ncbi:MAG TPA: allophanate hydrolase, partial [Rhodospirillaceae bacterium]|nr:allophanate hydrolase [Rhodospirillaceae bacterium]
MTSLPDALTIDDLHRAYADGMTAAEVIEEVFRRIAAVDDPGIFIHLPEIASVLAEAEALGAYDPVAKPLWGVPFAAKDNIDVRGMPTTAACPAFEYIPDEDAQVVRRLRDAGAIVIGKANLDQFATGLVGTRTPYPVPRNSLDADLVPGGSSSGSAVAVAQGIVPFALGTDTAGSGRVPAGLNGLVGWKPSLGAMSTRGVVPACRTLDCVSVFAHSIGDAKRVFDVARAFDAQDAYSRPWAGEGRADWDGAAPRIGVPAAQDRKFFGDGAAQASYEATLADLKERGAEIVEVPFQPFYDIALLLYEGPWVAERYAAIDAFIETNEADLHPVTREITIKARNFSATDTFKAIYKLADLKRRCGMLIEGVDMLCVPTAPTWYTVAENLADPIGTNSRLGTYTNFVNLMGMCGLTLPTGQQSNGRPASVTFLAPDGGDHFLAGVGETFRSGAAFGGGAAPVQSKSGDGGGIEIAVVGAHLKGLPLNGELTALGAQYLRSARTRADYRLYELPGSAPRKPGLLRVAEGQGHAIEVEVWS